MSIGQIKTNGTKRIEIKITGVKVVKLNKVNKGKINKKKISGIILKCKMQPDT
ncbi:hypothetical protein ACSAZL_08385 [Methanosarcina sp. T3]|uniref:hypothetical protein n=1 Tax=Methanosarcina sp. T3 TaxID=3439062 RepID=UPI003F84AE62